MAASLRGGSPRRAQLPVMATSLLRLPSWIRKTFGLGLGAQAEIRRKHGGKNCIRGLDLQKGACYGGDRRRRRDITDPDAGGVSDTEPAGSLQCAPCSAR